MAQSGLWKTVKTLKCHDDLVMQMIKNREEDSEALKKMSPWQKHAQRVEMGGFISGIWWEPSFLPTVNWIKLKHK